MSIGRTYATTFGQATQTLTLINQANLENHQLDRLHSGHLAALLKATKEDRLPTLSDLNAFLGRPPRILQVWWQLDDVLSKKKLISEMDTKQLTLRAEGATIDVAYEPFEKSDSGFHCRAVMVTPTLLGAEAFALEHLRHQDRQEYL